MKEENKKNIWKIKQKDKIKRLTTLTKKKKKEINWIFKLQNEKWEYIFIREMESVGGVFKFSAEKSFLKWLKRKSNDNLFQSIGKLFSELLKKIDRKWAWDKKLTYKVSNGRAWVEGREKGEGGGGERN